jgi:hypothetical protein
MDDHTFTVEKDDVGLGYCVIVKWSDGRRECVTGFGDQHHAEQWIRTEAPGWLLDTLRKGK